MRKKFLSVLLVSAMATSLLAGCGSDSTESNSTSDGGDTTAATSEDETTANTITGDASADDAFVVWGWNDDIKNILDNCYANDYKDNYDRIVFVNSGGSDYYQTQIDALLQDESNELYPDMMGLEIDYVQKYVQSGYLLSLADLGITNDDLASQYDFNRIVCSTDDSLDASTQYASFWQCTPGAWNIRADLAEKYLGTTDPDELQAMFATWEDVEATAQKVYEASNGSCKLLSGWDDLNRVFTNNRETGWYDSNDNIVIDSQVKGYFDEAKLFADNDWTFNTTQWGSDWYAMMDGTGEEGAESALAYTGCPWFQYWCLSDSWKDQTITIAGPQSFYWGGTGLAVTKACSDTEMAAEIVKYFTTDSDSMQTIAKYNCDFINNADANAALLEYSQTSDEDTAKSLASGNGLMYSQNYLEVYSNILDNMTIDTSVVKSEDKQINDSLSTYVQEYIDGGDYDTAIADLTAYIHDTFSYLNIQ
jgi:maltose-binding protein MalE